MNNFCPCIVDLKRYDQAIFTALKLQQPTHEIAFGDEKTYFAKVLMEGHVHGLLPSYDNEIIQDISDSRIEKWSHLSKDSLLAKCVDARFDDQTNGAQLKRVIGCCQAIYDDARVVDKELFAKKDLIGKVESLKLPERTGMNHIKTDIYNFVLKSLSKFDDKENDPSVMTPEQREIQSLYVTSHLQENVKILKSTQREAFINKVALEGQLLAHNKDIKQPQLEKLAVQIIDNHKENMKNFDKDTKDRVIAIHCLHGTKDIGTQLDNIKTMRKDLDRAATQMVNIQKEQERALQKANEKNHDYSHGPER